VPEPYRAFGHPLVAVGGLGRPSFVLLGTSEAERRTFASSCHRAGRDIGPPRELAKLGISLQAANPAALANAHPGIEDEIEVVTRAGLARRVASLRPFAIVKG
jgi:tRNA-splicing ligase RtcB